jgi:hypothetical protein
MTANITAQHDCADRGCLAAMFGVTLGDAIAGKAQEGSGDDAMPTRLWSR